VTLPLFAPESQRVFYWGTREEEAHRRYDVVADGTVVPTPFVEIGDLVLAPGGRRWAARGPVSDESSGGAEPRRRVAVVVDGREVGRFAAASRPAFSQGGLHLAWLAQDDGGRTTVFVDEAPVRTVVGPPPPPGDPLVDGQMGVGYLSDGRLVALLPEGDGWSLYRGDERLAVFAHTLIPGSTLILPGADTRASIVSPSLVTATDSPTVVWWERRPGNDERWRVMRDGAPIDGLECARYWDTQPPVVSADGTHVAYVCATPPQPEAALGYRWIVLDGRRFGPYIESWTLGLAPDGSEVAYGAAETLPITTWRIFVNGVPRSGLQELVWRPRFSLDGRHLFWAGGPERGRRRIAIDRRTVTRFDDLLSGPEFPSPRTATWAIRRGRTISQIEARF
jgi:hypothetical protein